MTVNKEQRHDDFLRLLSVNEPTLRAFLRSLVPRREDVPEVMQEVAVVLWRKFGDLSAHGDFRKWAFGVARLEALAWARDKARDRHVFDAELLATLADAAENSSQRLIVYVFSGFISWLPSRPSFGLCCPIPLCRGLCRFLSSGHDNNPRSRLGIAALPKCYWSSRGR